MEELQLTASQVKLLATVMEERHRFLRENDAALDELARMVAAVGGLPATGGKLGFFQDGPDAPIVLRFTPD